MMERAMAWLPCPVCGKEAKADVRATFLPEQYVLTDEGEGVYLDAVYLWYKVKKHRRCKCVCDLGKVYYTEPTNRTIDDINELMDSFIDDFQRMMEKGEYKWKL